MIDVGYLRLTPSAPLLVLLVPVSTGGGGGREGVPVFSRERFYWKISVAVQIPEQPTDPLHKLYLNLLITIKNMIKFKINTSFILDHLSKIMSKVMSKSLIGRTFECLRSQTLVSKTLIGRSFLRVTQCMRQRLIQVLSKLSNP